MGGKGEEGEVLRVRVARVWKGVATGKKEAENEKRPRKETTAAGVEEGVGVQAVRYLVVVRYLL